MNSSLAKPGYLEFQISLSAFSSWKINGSPNAQSHKSSKPGCASLGVVPSLESPQHGWIRILFSRLGLRKLLEVLCCLQLHPSGMCGTENLEPKSAFSFPAPEPQPGPSKKSYQEMKFGLGFFHPLGEITGFGISCFPLVSSAALPRAGSVGRDIHEQLPELSTPSLPHPWEEPELPWRSPKLFGVPVQGTLDLLEKFRDRCLGPPVADGTSVGQDDFVTTTGSLSTKVFLGSHSLG